MKTVSVNEFRQQAKKVIQQLRQGQRMVLTYRGRPVARLEPIVDPDIEGEDPFYSLHQLADVQGGSLTNRQIDQVIYDT